MLLEAEKDIYGIQFDVVYNANEVTFNTTYAKNWTKVYQTDYNKDYAKVWVKAYIGNYEKSQKCLTM